MTQQERSAEMYVICIDGFPIMSRKCHHAFKIYGYARGSLPFNLEGVSIVRYGPVEVPQLVTYEDIAQKCSRRADMTNGPQYCGYRGNNLCDAATYPALQGRGDVWYVRQWDSRNPTAMSAINISEEKEAII